MTASAAGLAVTGPANGLIVTASAAGLAVTGPANGLIVTASAAGLAITGPASGLIVTASAAGLAVTGPANGLIVTASAAGLAITPPANGLLITSTGLAVEMGVATSDVSATRVFSSTAGGPDTTYNVMEWPTFTFGVVNASTTIAPATVKLQISPDATSWIDHAGPTTLNTGDVTALVSSIFLKYARVYYAAVDAASTVTLNIFFQSQT
ncbi:MAG: DUF6385 domain-containing protein [Bacillota bacterium]